MNARVANWLLFLLYPFLGMIVAFLDYTKPYSKNIFWAFCAFYGYTFAIGVESQGSDINRYLEELQFLYSYHSMSLSDFIAYFRSLGEIDIINTVILYFISRITASQAILTLVYALIFGFFLSRNIWFVFSRLKNRLDTISRLLLLGMILVIPIWFINGFRMWVAFHIFMFGLLPYIFDNDKRKIPFLFLAIATHFSYLIPVSVLLIYFLLGNRKNLFFIIFIVTSFISEINISAINRTIDQFLPEVFIERTAGYRNEDAVERIREIRDSNNSGIWYVKWHRKLLRWSFYVLVIYFFLFNRRFFMMSNSHLRLYCFVLLFFSFANITSSLPSGGRFANFYIFLIFVLLLVYLDKYQFDFKFRWFLKILSPAIILFIVVSIRIGIYSTSLSTVFGNPVIALFSAGQTIPINDLIK